MAFDAIDAHSGFNLLLLVMFLVRIRRMNFATISRLKQNGPEANYNRK